MRPFVRLQGVTRGPTAFLAGAEPAELTCGSSPRRALLPPIDRFAALAQPRDDLRGDLRLFAGDLAERPEPPRGSMVVVDHLVDLERIQLSPRCRSIASPTRASNSAMRAS